MHKTPKYVHICGIIPQNLSQINAWNLTSALALWFSLIQYYVWIVLSQFQNLAGPTYRDALFKVKHHTFICCYGQPKVIYLMSDFWSTCPTLPKHIVAQAHIFQLVVHSRNHAFPRSLQRYFFHINWLSSMKLSSLGLNQMVVTLK